MKTLLSIIGVSIVCGAPLPSTAEPAPAAKPETAEAKAVKEARTKRYLQMLEDDASVLTVYDRSGHAVATHKKPALYGGAVFSPDGKRVAVTRSELADLEHESADLWVIDLATGKETRLTSVASREWVWGPVWSSDGTHVAYVSIRAGVEGLYRRAANGQGPEELLYKHSGAGMDLSDWSSDGRLFAFSLSDLAGADLFVLPLDGERKPRRLLHSDDKRISGARFSPDGRFVSYALREKSSSNGRGEIFVRPVDPASHEGPWQITNGHNVGTGFWRRDGKQLYHLGSDRSVMVAEVETSPTFTFTKPKPLFRPAGIVPDRISSMSRDGERFLADSPAKGPKLQQITIFDRKGQVIQKVGEPGMYSMLAFSDDGKRLAVMKTDLSTWLDNIWVMDVATGKSTQLTNDALWKVNVFWSHDGRYVLYSAFRVPNMGIFRKAADGSGPEELLYEYTAGAGIFGTDLSRDGKLLIAESGGVILAVPLTGTEARGREAIEYVRSEFDCSQARLSPDGKLMAFASDEIQAERDEIYVRPFDVTRPARDGDTKWQVSKQGANGMLQWRADGKEIFFGGLNLENHDYLVMAVDVSTSPAFHAGAPRLLFKVPGPVSTGNFGDTGLANATRDGRRFVFPLSVPVGPPR